MDNRKYDYNEQNMLHRELTKDLHNLVFRFNLFGFSAEADFLDDAVKVIDFLDYLRRRQGRSTDVGEHTV